MNIPGFTAEVSIYSSIENYRMASMERLEVHSVTPQGWGCLAAAAAGHIICGAGCGIAAHVICEMLTDEGKAY